MQLISLVFFWGLFAITLHNMIWLVVAMRVLHRQRGVGNPPDGQLPKAAVLLCLRGVDPNLPECLRRLLRQDYPDYQLFIAVDSESDRAWKVVQDTIQSLDANNVHVAPLRNRRSTCSLKCSSLVQLVDELDDSHEVIVLADADLQSHPSWLRQLVTPLLDPRVGATFGNRWFLPAKGWLGSLVRQLWNGPGLVAMFALEIPWAGSLAIRSDVFRRGRLREAWSRSIVDDGPVRAAVKRQKLKLQFVPSLIMANREECNLGFACNFLTRQLTWTRTYVRSWWPMLLGYTLLSVGSWTAAVILAVLCALRGSDEAAICFAAGAAVVGGPLFLSWLILDIQVRHIIRRQGEPAPSAFSRQLLQLPTAMLITAWVHLGASLVATVRRRVVWRGVTYEIRGPSNVRMIADRSGGVAPATTSSPAASAVSI